MIYAAKPQRGGRSIQANTNNPPQDPPPKSVSLDDIPKVPYVSEVPDISIEDSTPPVPECTNEKPKLTKPEKIISKSKPKTKLVIQKVTPKQSLFRRFLTKILKIFGRK